MQCCSHGKRYKEQESSGGSIGAVGRLEGWKGAGKNAHGGGAQTDCKARCYGEMEEESKGKALTMLERLSII